MLIKRKLLLLVSLALFQIAFGQHVDEGWYNDWDYGPHGVYGNLPLTKVMARTYFKIVKSGPQTVTVQQINPSGIIINTDSVTFVNGVLNEVDRIDQWGDTYEYRRYEMKEENNFRVTDLVRGKNIFLPCKYALYSYKGELLSGVQFYSFRGELAADKNGVAIIEYMRYDDPIRFAERKETSFFDAQHRPVISKSAGYHKLVFQYDENDNKTSESYFGIRDESITLRESSVSKMQFFYDADNNLIMDEYLGLGDKVTPNINGVARAGMEYESGYLMKVTRFDSLGNTTQALASGDGISVIKYEYDKGGNITREAYFDQSWKPMNNHAGVQEIASFFSSDNMRTRVAYFDQFGNPCVNRDKINSTVFINDEKNRVIQESSYGVDGKPLKTYTEQVFMIKRRYDKSGRNISNSYWADSNTIMPRWDGSYETATKFDEDGQPVEYGSFDENGKPFITEDGSSSMKLIYDSDGRLEERQFLNNNKLISRKRGVTMHYSIVKYGYDQNGKENELTFWDTDQKQVNATIWIHDSVSAHRILFIYRGNRIVEQRYYKTGAQEPFQIVDCLKNDFINLNAISIGRKNEN